LKVRSLQDNVLPLDGFDLPEQFLEFLKHSLHSDVFGVVILEVSIDALPVKGVKAGEYVELSLEDAGLAQIALLLRVYRDVLVPLLPLLLPQFLRALAVLT
jgi:hypothetical protein